VRAVDRERRGIQQWTATVDHVGDEHGRAGRLVQPGPIMPGRDPRVVARRRRPDAGQAIRRPRPESGPRPLGPPEFLRDRLAKFSAP
jgi:hypothetical protein